MKTVMIYSYTASNFGDDLFVYTLCKRFPKINFKMYAPKIYKKTFENLSNLTIIPSDTTVQRTTRGLLKLFNIPYHIRNQIAKNCDFSIYIGGSIFMETIHWKQDLEHIKAMQQHNPLFIIGANFGPYYSREFHQTYEKIFSNAVDVCFRDLYSYKLFKHLPQVRYGSDIVFQLETNINTQTKNYIVISVIDPSIRSQLRKYANLYFDRISYIVKTYIKSGYHVVLSSFCQFERDEHAINKILNLIPKKFQKEISTHFYKANIVQTLKLFSQARAIVATRFHAMILGFLFKKPTFPIIYSDKMLTILHDMEFKGICWKINELDEVKKHYLLNFEQNIHLDINDEIEKANKHFIVLNQHLKRK